MEMPWPNNNENPATHQHHGQEIIEVGEQNGNQENNIEIVHQDPGNSSGNNKRRRKESKVWEEMTKYEGKDGKVCAKCTHCEKEFDGSSKKGTTHLKNHLERCPVKRKKGGGDADKSMKTTVDLTSSVVSKEESAVDLIKNLLCGGDSSALNSRKIEIFQVYKEEKDKLRQFLHNLSCRFSLQILRSGNFYVWTVHYIDDNWKLMGKIISCLKFPKSDYLKDNIETHLKELCTDLKINENICSIVYDCFDEYEAYDAATGEINSWLNQSSLPFGCSLFDIRQIDFYRSRCNEDWYSVSGIKRCVDYVKSPATDKRKLEIAIDKVNSMGKTSISSDNFLFDLEMFEASDIPTSYKEVFCELEQIDPDFKSINLTKEEWDDATITFEYFYELFSVLYLCDSEDSTPNMFFPMFCDVYIKLLQRRTSEGYHPGKKTSPLMEKVASSMQQKFVDRYWSKYNLVLVITAILDPRFKMEIVQLWYYKIYGIDADDNLEKINDDFTNVYDKYASCGSANGDYTSSISYLDAMGRPRTSSEGVSSKSELERYLKDDPKCPPYEKLDILAWWRANNEIYPTLARMARDFLAVPIRSYSFSFIDDLISLSWDRELEYDIGSAVISLVCWLDLVEEVIC